MWLQYPTSIYNREGYCVIDEAHTSFQKVMLNGVDSLSYRGRVEQPFFFRLKLYLSSTGPPWM